MPEILTESFCERCGTRYTFEAAEPKGKRLGKLKTFSKGFVNFVTNDEASLDEAFAEARSDEQRELTNQQLDAFHQTFQFCMSCRQYTCANCWNETESRCLSCAPLLGADLLDAAQPRLDPLARIFGETAEPAAANGHANGIGLIGGANGELNDHGSAWPAADVQLDGPAEAATLPALGAGPTTPDAASTSPEAVADELPAEGSTSAEAVAAEEPPSAETIAAEGSPSAEAVAAEAETGEAEPIDDDVALAVAAAEIARRAAAEHEHERELAAEAERAREAEAQLEAERLRQAEEERARQAAEAEARTRAEQELAAEAAAADADRSRQAEADAERDRLVREEAERQLAADAERQRQAEAEAQHERLVREEAERQLAADAERQRQAEAERAAAAQREADAERDRAAAAAEPPARDDRIETPTWQIVAPEQPEPGAGPLDVGPTILAPQPPLPARPAATNGGAPGANGSARPAGSPDWPGPATTPPPQWPMPVQPPATDLWAASSQDVVNRPGGGVQACVSCGLSLSASARFCRRCGTQQH